MTTSPERRALIAKVHIAKKDLAIEDGAYRAMLTRLTGFDSAAKATDAGLKSVLAELKAKGWQDKPKKSARGRGADPRDQANKLRALWWALWQLGEVREPGDSALAAFVCRHTKIEALRWNRLEDLQIAIECLKSWCVRIGYRAEPFTSLGGSTVAEGKYYPCLIAAQWQRLVAAGAFKAGAGARLDIWLQRMGWPVAAPQFLDASQGRAAADELGRWLRRIKRKAEDEADAPA